MINSEVDDHLDKAKTHLRCLAEGGSRPITADDLARFANVLVSCTEALLASVAAAIREF